MSLHAKKGKDGGIEITSDDPGRVLQALGGKDSIDGWKWEDAVKGGKLTLEIAPEVTAEAVASLSRADASWAEILASWAE